jgi:AcrR family transcriptional regulator
MCVSRVRVDTKTEIRKVALELFAQQGFDRTSLREIAERLDITKAALYYHYPSKNDLLRAIVTPLADDLRALVERHGPDPQDGEPLANPKALLYDYFDVCVRHSAMLIAVINDVGALSRSGLIEVLLDRRLRLDALLGGGGSHVSDRLGAVIALGGIQDAAVLLSAEEVGAHRERVVGIALAALEAGTSSMD